jgi:hypothetical protein
VDSLAEFLLARIAEDEAAANAAPTRQWRVADLPPQGHWASSGVRPGVQTAWVSGHSTTVVEVPDGGGAQPGVEAHIARWDPARVLAECEAKRRIIEGGGSQCGGYYPPGNEIRIEQEENAEELGIEFQPHWPEDYAPFCDGCAAAQSADRDWERTLRALAGVHSAHPDYRPEWRLDRDPA